MCETFKTDSLPNLLWCSDVSVPGLSTKKPQSVGRDSSYKAAHPPSALSHAPSPRQKEQVWPSPGGFGFPLARLLVTASSSYVMLKEMAPKCVLRGSELPASGSPG